MAEKAEVWEIQSPANDPTPVDPTTDDAVESAYSYVDDMNLAWSRLGGHIISVFNDDKYALDVRVAVGVILECYWRNDKPQRSASGTISRANSFIKHVTDQWRDSYEFRKAVEIVFGEIKD